MRLAFIVSHPIQYYVPIYRELARRGGVTVKVFYTWRDAAPAKDVKFGKEFAWDIPLMEGYDFEVVPNTSTDPGTHHRKGLINPDLVERVRAWKPDAVHITGYNYVSHGQAIKDLSRADIPVIFRGDSHLLDRRDPWWKWLLKKRWLSKVYSRPKGFAYVGRANRDYYRAFGVSDRNLFPVPHTIEVGRFAEPNDELEAKALAWRRELGIPEDHFVFLYAAKLEPRKRPMELLEAFVKADLPRATLVFVGSGELEEALRAKAKDLSHSRPQGDSMRRSRGQIDAGTKGFSHGLTQIIADESDRRAPVGRGGSAHAGGGAALAASPPNEEPKSASADEDSARCSGGQTDNGKRNTADFAHRVLFLPFQNQSTMPVVYRLGDALVLPSAYGETWGLAVNEAQACGRPALVSDCVGCGQDIVHVGENGMIFRTEDWEDCIRAMKRMTQTDWRGKRSAIRAAAWKFDTACGVDALLEGVRRWCQSPS